MNFRIFIIVICSISLLSLRCNPDDDINDRIDFTLSHQTAFAFENVSISMETSQGVEFFIDTPDSFQHEFTGFDGSLIGDHLDYPGIYRLTQLGFNDNFVEIEVYPNLVVWSDFQGAPIDITITNIQGDFNGQVNCVTSSPPPCADYKNSLCGFFAINPRFINTFIASDGTNSWGSSISAIPIENGECAQLLLSNN